MFSCPANSAFPNPPTFGSSSAIMCRKLHVKDEIIWTAKILSPEDHGCRLLTKKGTKTGKRNILQYHHSLACYYTCRDSIIHLQHLVTTKNVLSQVVIYLGIVPVALQVLPINKTLNSFLQVSRFHRELELPVTDIRHC